MNFRIEIHPADGNAECRAFGLGLEKPPKMFVHLLEAEWETLWKKGLCQCS